MLVLTRKLDQTIVIDGEIRLTVLAISGGKIRIGIQAPDDVTVLREELLPAGPGGPRPSILALTVAGV